MTESTEKTYAWRGRGPAGVSAQATGELIDSIAERDGKVEPSVVVDEARPKESPIHGAFEWRNAVAAEEHRKWQARQLVRNVRVIATADDGEKSSTPVVVHVPKDHGRPGGYYAASAVVQDQDLFMRAATEAERKLASASATVNELRQIASTTDNSDKLAAIAIAAKSLATASRALQVIH